jgi:hypothetical protein
MDMVIEIITIIIIEVITMIKIGTDMVMMIITLF